LGLLAECALSADLDRGTAGDRYQMVLHVDIDGASHDATGSHAATDVRSSTEDVSAETRPVIARETSSVSRASMPGALEQSSRQATVEEAVDAVDASEDVYAKVAGASSSALDNRHQITVVAVPDVVERPSGHAVLEVADSAAYVSAETYERLSCDAAMVVMRHDADGSVLDVGRKTRSIPPAIRRALMARDPRCQFPGCTTRRCDAHHLTHWRVDRRAAACCPTPDRPRISAATERHRGVTVLMHECRPCGKGAPVRERGCTPVKTERTVRHASGRTRSGGIHDSSQ